MKISKKVIGIIIAVVVIGAALGVYFIMDNNKIQVVTLTISTDKKVYNMGKNVTIIVKESPVHLNFQISSNATYPNGVPGVGMEICWIPPSISPSEIASIKNSSEFLSHSPYRGFVPYVINNRHLTYKLTWNQTIVEANRPLGNSNALEFRAPSGYYIIRLGLYQIDEGFGKFVIHPIYKNAIFFIKGLNYTLNNNTLHLRTTDNMNFHGKIVFWRLTDPWNSTFKYFTSIPFNYTGKNLTINFENYPNVISVKRLYQIYIVTPYGKYWVGNYVSPGSSKS